MLYFFFFKMDVRKPAGAGVSCPALTLGVAAALALLLAPSPARAVNECGALNSGNSFTETCADQAYASGITYSATSAATLTVGGGPATTITSPTTGASWNNGITINIANSMTRRDLSLTVGSAGAVAIRQGASPQANAWYRNNGIQVVQRSGGGSTVTVDVRSGVTIGTSTTRMANSGISLALDNAAVTGAGAMSLTSGATIYAATHGINFGNSGPGATTVINTGAIDASNQGIRVEDTGSAGAVTITNSGAITSGWQGIFAQTRGTGKDAAGTNAGVSVTHSGGAITSSNQRGIQVLVGASRQELNAGHASYVAPMNVGTAKVAVTGGAISSQLSAIEAINYEAGGVNIAVSSTSVTLTSSTGSGIYAGLHDVGNTAGGIDVDNKGEITAAVTGIWVRRIAPMGTGAIRIDNDGDIKKTGAAAGYGIRVDESGIGGVTVDNSGAIGEASATNQHQHGIFVSHSSTGAGDVSITNRGAIRASQSGIYLHNQGSGTSMVTNNSGAITASQRGIYVRERGSAGAVDVRNSGDITAAWTGILAQTTGKDAEGANAGVSVTHSGGALTSTAGHGIEALVGVGRQEGNTGHDDYVAPKNEGLAKVAVTGGSISAQRTAIAAINYEAGSVEVDVSEDVTLTSATESGIFAQVADVGNTDGTVTVVNAGTISAPAAGRRGIFAVNEAGGAVTVRNSGAITAGEVGIYADIGVVTVENGADITSGLHGIFARTPGNDDAGTNLGVTVTHSGGTIKSENGRGVRAHVGRERQEVNTGHANYVAPMNTGLVKVKVTGGSIESKWQAIEAVNFEAGGVEIDVAEGATLTSTGNSAINAQLTDVGNLRGTINITNAGTLKAAVAGIFSRIVAGTGDMTVINRGAIEAPQNAIFALGARSYAGNIMLTNSGALGTANAKVRRGIFVAHDGPSGGVTVANSGDIVATDYGIQAHKANGRGGGVTVTHSGGVIDVDSAADEPVLDSQKHGIVARVGGWNQETDPDHDDYVAPRGAGAVKVEVTGGSIASRGTAVEGANYEGGGVEIAIASGVTLSSAREHGIEADLRDVGNTDGTIKITQGGAIRSGGDGISAVVTRSTPATLDEPVIDIAWTGTYAAPEQPAPDESIVFVAQAPRVVQAAQAVEAVETLRGEVAGIDAKVMEWQAFMGVVAEGDDPGAFADAAAQAALFDDAADAATQARAAAIVAQFRSTLTAGTAGSIRDAGDVDANGDDSYSDEEIVAYLSEDSNARRTLLRNVLAASLTDDEMTVFRAVIEGGDLDAALAAVPNSYTDAWKAKVRALLNSHNDGDIRIAMNGGSITSRGDGIRATYARPHDDNGAISVTVGKGASVTGGVAGVYVANAGQGLRIEKKYAPQAVRDADANRALGDDDPVTVENYLNQVVRVDGTVTGGTDAAVHLAGGGALIVGENGRLIGGSSGEGILVNDPGPAIIWIAGAVQGGADAPADKPTPAVHLTGDGVMGSSVTVAQTGMITGEIGIRLPAASTVENYGTIVSTDGTNGLLIDFEGTGASVVRMYEGSKAVGIIQLDREGGDVVDASDAYVTDVMLEVKDTAGNDLDLGDNYKPPTKMRPGDTRVGDRMAFNRSAFALTDDMLSDLTGSIHLAVVESGMRPGIAGSVQQTVWATPFGGARDQDSSSDVADVTHYFGGGMIGTNWGTTTLRVGGFLGGSVGQLDVGRNQGGQTMDVDVQTIFGGVYAQRAVGDVIYDARMLVGRMTHDSTRRLVGDTAEVEYHSIFLSPEVGIATDVALMSRLHATPRLRVRYAGLFTDDFRESGKMTNTWDLQVDERTMHLVEGRAEVGIPFALENGGQINPRIGVEGRWLLAGSEIKGTLGDTPFNRDAGGDDAVFTGTVGVGVSLPVADSMTLIGSFDGALTTEEAWRALGYLGLTYSF